MAQPQLAAQASVEVLAPKLDLTAMLAKTAEIEQLFKVAVIPTDRSSQYFRWLDEIRLIRQCGRVVGPRAVGKSHSSKHYRDESGKKVVYVKAWTGSSSKRLFGQILKAMKHAASTGKRHDLRSRLAGCLEPFGIEMLIIDNAENLQQEAFLDLKQLFEETGVLVVLAGSSELDDTLIELDLLPCFPGLFEFDRLDHDDFRKTLRTIELDVLQLPQASNLAEGTMFEILASSSGARMGVLIEILTKAVLHSLKKGYGKVDEATLIRVVDRHGQKYLPPEARQKLAQENV